MKSLQVLLTGLVDYAGLFPPAALPMPLAVAAYASYRRGRWAWVLGRFVVPAARLDEFDAAARDLLPAGDGAIPWRLAALLAGDPRQDVERVAAFNAGHSAGPTAGRAVIDVVEARVGSPGEVPALRRTVPPNLALVCEAPLDGDLGDVLDAIREAGATAKARLGGTVPGAFPTSRQVAAFLAGCATRDIPFKATAGLHHPVRGRHPLTGEAGAATADMHGFLNVFFASAWAREMAGDPGVPAIDRLVEVLDSAEPDAFGFDEEGATWRGVRLDVEVLARARERFALSFGSCSFEEPIDELRARGWAV
jgi:hypothetical protein